MRPPAHPNAAAMTLILRAGTAASTVLLSAGLVLAVIDPHTRLAQLMLTAGLLILMLTPVANLLVALADEIAAREWTFVGAGVLVLLLLSGSLLVAFR